MEEMLNEQQIKEMMEMAKKGDKKVCVFGCGFLLSEFSIPFLRYLGIKIDFLCDNNCSYWGTEISDGIYCEPLQTLERQCDDVICFLMIRADYLNDVYCQLVNLGVKCIVTYADIMASSLSWNYFFEKDMSNDTIVYTCIVGDYDTFRKPEIVMEGCDYILIGDREPQYDIYPYKYLDIESIVPNEIQDNTRKNRYVKINAHRIFDNYKYSIYHDGNIVIKKDITNYLEQLSICRIATAGASYSSNVYDETMRCIVGKRDSEEILRAQIRKYYLSGMPRNRATYFCNVLIREHNNPVCVKLMEDWWSEVKNYSRRDQISLPYVVWKNGYKEDDVLMINSEYTCNSPYWDFIHEHKINRNTGI